MISSIGSKALVLGLGLSGRSAARLLLSKGISVVGVDKNHQLLEHDPDIGALRALGLKTITEEHCEELSRYDIVIASPGIPESHPILQQAKALDVTIIGEVELGCRIASQKMIAITGTNGKTTTTLLIEHVLNFVGKRAKALGNVGVPFSQELLTLASNVDIILELSSYQLENLIQKCIRGGVILNITPDHLDRYCSMEDYAKAKCHLEDCLVEGAPLYLEEETFQQYRHLIKRKDNCLLYGYSNTSYIFSDLDAVYREGHLAFKLPTEMQGKRSHDLENGMAAFALSADEGITGEQFVEAWLSFKKPSHRIEFVLEYEGVNYIDDSKGTNIDAVIRAVQVVQRPIILIAGGVDKGTAYTPWIDPFKNKVKFICAIGQAAGKIQDQLRENIPVFLCQSMEDAVKLAKKGAHVGDSVLLSPGCSSYDMYRDYAHRGNVFQEIVKQLCC